ncbi:hypothetical protein BVY03_04565 [bacterium K02(2017)]|nr:hypothetical protein BVY03_04565 [bacterium K02(2017)]
MEISNENKNNINESYSKDPAKIEKIKKTKKLDHDTKPEGFLARLALKKIETSREYQEKIEKIVDKIKGNGIDVLHLGPMTYAQGVIGIEAAASVLSSSNLFNLGGATGGSDWMLELTIVHEHKHRLQNEGIWQEMLRAHHLDPLKYNLYNVSHDENIPQEYIDVYQKYMSRIVIDNQKLSPYDELDAYLYMYDYFDKYIKKDVDLTTQVMFVSYMKSRIGIYAALLNDELTLTDKNKANDKKAVLTPYMKTTLDRSKKVYLELKSKLSKLGDKSLRKEIVAAAHNRLDQVFKKYSQTLKFDNDKKYSMHERLFVLSGAIDELHSYRNLAKDMFEENPFKRDVNSFYVKSQMYSKELENLRNRQVFRSTFQIRDETLLGLEYRNDVSHSSDGFRRDQHFLELDMLTKGPFKLDVKAGLDRGYYYHLSDNIFLKSALAGYAGFQTDQKNFMVGARADLLSIHWDIPITQRLGISLLAGYSVGAELGSSKSKFYDEARVGIEFFRY